MGFKNGEGISFRYGRDIWLLYTVSPACLQVLPLSLKQLQVENVLKKICLY